jgi:hypothetical protein
MGRLYRIETIIAGALAVACALTGGAVLAGIVPPPREPPAWVPLVVCLAFLMFNGVLYLRRRAPLPFPWPRVRIATAMIAIGLFGATALYRIVNWPAGPLRMKGHSYVDKRGRAYSEESFRAYNRWQTALLLISVPFTLVLLTSLPAAPIRRPRP